MDRWIDGWMDRQIDKQINGWMDRQIDMWIFVQAVYLWNLCIVACDSFNILYAATLTWLNKIKQTQLENRFDKCPEVCVFFNNIKKSQLGHLLEKGVNVSHKSVHIDSHRSRRSHRSHRSHRSQEPQKPKAKKPRSQKPKAVPKKKHHKKNKKIPLH